jgi:hypothetical protein
VDESGRVVQVEGAGSCDTFGAQNGHGELFTKQIFGSGREKVRRCVNVYHGHGQALDRRLDLAL